MKQENSFESKLRSIENGESHDIGLADDHWLQMRSLLQPSSLSVKKDINSRSIGKRALAGLFILAGVAFIYYYEQNSQAKENNTILPGAMTTTQPAIANRVTEQGTPVNIKKLVSMTGLRPNPGTSSLITRKDQHPSPVNAEIVTGKNEQRSTRDDDINIIAAGRPNEDEKNRQLLAQFFGAVEKPSQQFVINNNRDTNLVCVEGTKVFIPANVFQDNNNVPVSGQVSIEIKEFYSYDDIIGNKLSTTSNGQQLISGGMLYIMAMQNGREIKLAAAKMMTIRMPATGYDEQMQLFTGERSMLKENDFTYDYNKDQAINWQPAGQFQRLPRSRFFIKTFDPYGQPYKTWERKDGLFAARFVITKNCRMSKKEVLANLRGRYGYLFSDIKLRRSLGNHPRPLFSKHDRPIVGDSAMIEYQVAKQLNLLSKEDIVKYEKQLLQDSLSLDERIKGMTFYEFQMSRLGFMNCDRFQNDNSPKVEFTLRMAEGENADNIFAVLAFDRYRSVMPGFAGKNKLLFRQVPENARVHIICVAVKNGKVVSCIKALQAGTEEVTGLQFEETTPESFKKQMASLRLKGS
jgi:hypothetical protein